MEKNIFEPSDQEEKSVTKIVHAVYLLQALSFFVPCILMIIAVIINYLKRSDAIGTWLESHFIWQIRTFWYGILWIIVGSLLAIFTAVIAGPFSIGVLFVTALGAIVWLLYRIIKGWLRLNDGKPISVKNRFSAAQTNGIFHN